MYFNSVEFLHLLVNYKCCNINGKFIAIAKNMTYSNYPLLMAYSIVRLHLQFWNAHLQCNKTPDVS